MATVSIASDLSTETLADLLDRVGDVPLERIPAKPPLGTATEDHVVASLEAANKRLFELVDGVLVEKTMGTKEGMWASLIGYYIWNYFDRHDLGVVVGADSPVRLRLGLIRIPDVSFISWDRLPDGELPDEAIASIIPDLTVEVISRSNTKREMALKLENYFRAGVRLVWFLYPESQTAKVYTSPTKVKRIDRDQSLVGGEVLPGFSLPLKQLFARGKRRRSGH
jgi:Uma2 family endonuclease